MSFKVGDRVVVTDTNDAYSGTLPLGSIDVIKSTYPDDNCGPNEVLLHGNNIYHDVQNLALVESYASIDHFRAIVTALREEGYEITGTIKAPSDSEKI